MATIYQTLTYVTGSISAGASTSRNDSIVGNVANIVKIKVVPSNVSAGELTQVQIFKHNTFLSADLVYNTISFSGNLIDPIETDGTTSTERNEGFVCAYEDLDAVQQLHTKISNNGTVAKTYTVTIEYAVALLSYTTKSGLAAISIFGADSPIGFFRNDGVLSFTTGLSTAPDGTSRSGVTFPRIVGDTANSIALTTGAPTQLTTTEAGLNLYLWASDAVAGSSVNGAAKGGMVWIGAGDGKRLVSGNANGGDILLQAGSGVGTGTVGQVFIGQGGTGTVPGLAGGVSGSTAAKAGFTWGNSGAASFINVIVDNVSIAQFFGNDFLGLNNGSLGTVTHPWAAMAISSDAGPTITWDRHTTDAAGVDFELRKSRGTAAIPSNVVQNDNIVSIGGFAYSGATGYWPIGSQVIAIDGAVVDNQRPGTRFEWRTNLPNSAVTLNMELFGDGGFVLGSPTGGSKGAATVNLSGAYYQQGTKVLGARQTGWTAWTGTADRTTHNADGPATTTQLGQALKALIDDLISHGIIGT